MFSGPVNNQIATQISFVEFPFENIRDKVLAEINDVKKLELKDSSGAKVRFDRLKSQRQLTRNWALKRAKELIDQHPDGKGKHVELKWRIDGSSDRRILVDSVAAFTQSNADLLGSFASPFANLSFS